MNLQWQRLKKITADYAVEKNLTEEDGVGIFEELMRELEEKMGKKWVESINLEDKETIKIISTQANTSAVTYFKVKRFMDYLEKKLKDTTQN